MLDDMHLGDPLADIIPGPRGQLLATLAQLEAPVTVRALARYAGVAPQTAINVVNDLADAGIVSAERAGSAHMITLNRAHILAEPLISLSRTRARLIQRLTDELATWPLLAAAWMFGSAARGTGDRESDVDLLLVAEASTQTARWADGTAQLAEHVLSWTGNHAQLVEHTRSSFVRLVRSDNPLVAAVRADGIALTPRSRSLLRQAA
jgi:predicted nucleotidyltransferase